MPECPFCEMARDDRHQRKQITNALGFAVRDGFPVSNGHTLIIPNRHVQSFFDLTEEERAALLLLLDQAKSQIAANYSPDGYNIGINDGPAAGQTVPHLHIHLIPRYHKEGDDPRGGVRWVIPQKANYWSNR
ncbi:MAG: HIT family protein [Porticoccaceae bacterium]|nr:HIT family protein [Porticoccaceae bacterium]